MPQVSEQERETTRTAELQVTPLTSGRADVGEVNLERDAEMSGKTPEPVEKPRPETEKTDSYQHYIMTGKGDTLEQKVNEAVKDLNYHDMLVVLVVGDKTINNIGSISAVAEKWGLSYSIVQRAISGVKEHWQGGQQYDKMAGQPQRRSRCREDESDQGAPPLQSLRPAKEKVPGKHQKGKFKKSRQRRIAVAVTNYLMYHFKRCREWEVKDENQGKTQPGPNY